MKFETTVKKAFTLNYKTIKEFKFQINYLGVANHMSPILFTNHNFIHSKQQTYLKYAIPNSSTVKFTNPFKISKRHALSILKIKRVHFLY